MANLNIDRAQIAVKVEGTEGTAEALTAAEATVKVHNVTYDPDTPYYDDESVSASQSPFAGTPGGPITGSLSFDVYLVGGGAAGTAPAWGTLLKGCGWDETVNVGVSVVYSLNSDQGYSLTLGYYVDGTYHQLHGARGSTEWQFKSGDRGILRCTLNGVFNDMSDVALLSPTYASVVPPAWIGGALSLHSQSIKASTLSIMQNNNVALREDPSATYGAFSYALVGKRHMTGTVDPELVTTATKNWHSTVRAGTLSSLSWNLGSAAGNTIAFSCPKVAIKKRGLADRSRYATAPMDLALIRNSDTGDDEMTITVT